MARLDTRLRRVFAYLAILVLAGVLAPMVAEQPALAQCFACDGVDPNTNGCTGTQTIYEFTSNHTGVRVELRYSSACGGAWTRLTQPGNARYGTDIFLQSKDGYLYTHHLASGSQEWTLMMPWTRTLRSCYGWGFNGGSWNNYTEFSCTPWW
ncbi:DUF2690 domain-containing protein [Planosporangium sp. 12N6]|uniref:DUF2690 domain-containing protein n=1 Tax=Planosporangium spinosum TaxID=3402278 RepID=UPI003CE6AA38